MVRERGKKEEMGEITKKSVGDWRAGSVRELARNPHCVCVCVGRGGVAL